MKKIILLLILLVVSTSVVTARTKKRARTGSSTKNGWVKQTKTDEYTTETSYIMFYYKNGLVQAVYFPEDEMLKVIKYYDGLKYFDQTWDAMMDNNGRLPDQYADVSMRIIRTKTDYDEQEFYKSISFTDVSTPGDPFFSFFFVSVDAADLKKAQSISFKWFDKMDYDTYAINISLSGFTTVYNACTR